jgi:hypothetical protein
MRGAPGALCTGHSACEGCGVCGGCEVLRRCPLVQSVEWVRGRQEIRNRLQEIWARRRGRGRLPRAAGRQGARRGRGCHGVSVGSRARQLVGLSVSRGPPLAIAAAAAARARRARHNCKAPAPLAIPARLGGVGSGRLPFYRPPGPGARRGGAPRASAAARPAVQCWEGGACDRLAAASRAAGEGRDHVGGGAGNSVGQLSPAPSQQGEGAEQGRGTTGPPKAGGGQTQVLRLLRRLPVARPGGGRGGRPANPGAPGARASG